MAEGGAVGEAHRLDAVVVIDHRFSDGDSVVGTDELEDQRSAVSGLLDDQITD